MQIVVERAVLKMSAYKITLIIRLSTGYENYGAVRISPLIFSAPEQMYSLVVQEKMLGKMMPGSTGLGCPRGKLILEDCILPRIRAHFVNSQ